MKYPKKIKISVISQLKWQIWFRSMLRSSKTIKEHMKIETVSGDQNTKIYAKIGGNFL